MVNLGSPPDQRLSKQQCMTEMSADAEAVSPLLEVRAVPSAG
jgi:hypothetical protein